MRASGSATPEAPTRFRLRSPPPDPPEAPIPTTSPLPLLSLLAAVACSSPVALPPRATAIAARGDQPDLLLFLAPGLRADFPGTPGAEAAFTAPLAERLDARFSAAYSASPARWVGLGTLLTGRYPAAVPVCGLPSTGPRAAHGAPWCTSIPAEVPTLPEVLTLYGYQTALFTFHLAGQSLITGRFGGAHDLDPTWELPTTPWDTLAQSLSAWWAAHTESPRLAVVVVSDLMYSERQDLRQDLALDGWTGETPDGWAHTAGLHERAMARYQADAGAMGQHLADLLTTLDGGPRPMLALAGATNGMSLGELEGKVSQRDFFFSNSLVLERTVHVPLLMLGAPGAGVPAEVPRLVQLVDVLPTLSALAGAMPPANLAGESLLLEGHGDVAYAELGDMIAMRQGRLMLTFRLPRHNTCSLDPQFQAALQAPDHLSRLHVHDVVDDPLQLSAMEPGHGISPSDLGALYQDLLALREGPAAPAPGALSKEHIHEIHLTAAQGYW
ncbi:MAG: hypothetical protein ABIO70_25575 [Pseudomonadota bacterium]